MHGAPVPAVFVKVVDITADERGPKVGSCLINGLAHVCGCTITKTAGLAGTQHCVLTISLPSCPLATLQIGCSIKNVSQSDGTDLDPANTKYRPRGDGGGHQVCIYKYASESLQPQSQH